MSIRGRKCRIKIVKDGPYLVSGSVPLSEKNILPKRKTYEYQLKNEFPQAEEYTLCRCGHSKNPPYCDGAHVKVGFKGRETASREDYAVRAELQEGPGLNLLDDNRCAYARFCHREGGSAWELTDNSDNPHLRGEAIKAANDCPAGRLVVLDLDGNPIEPKFEPAIEILQDLEEEVSGPIFVKGNIPIESSEGFTYEVRNRVALCRCGRSRNKPFCDAAHVSVNYRDRK